MQISGFTIIKNAINNDYPVVEAIQSVLPLVDEMIVLIGDCSDDTEGLIKSINSEKIKIHHSVWNPNLRSGGVVLADETNKAFQLISPESTWAFYIQGDEVIHEKYYDNIIEACKKYKDESRVEGLLFKYVHFYGTYDYVGDSRRWYNKEVRIIRNNKKITSYKDAQGFRKGNEKLKVKAIDAYVYHYGWVKSPEQMMKKNKNVVGYWYKDEDIAHLANEPDFFDFNEFDSLKKFEGEHPSIMKKRIMNKNWLLNIDLSKKKFSSKDLLLYKIEKLTGVRLFDFKNYKKI